MQQDGSVNEKISIHAPHEGERPLYTSCSFSNAVFQSTLPTRGSDYTPVLPRRGLQISIHAPHEGERLEEIEFTRTDDTKFQSTLPTRGSDQ